MKQRILIVDQDPNYREILTSLLEKKGYMVTALEYGYQIGTALESKTFDIIFLDSETAGIRGKGFFAKIRKECPDSYIILITSKRVMVLSRRPWIPGLMDVYISPLIPMRY